MLLISFFIHESVMNWRSAISLCSGPHSAVALTLQWPSPCSGPQSAVALTLQWPSLCSGPQSAVALTLQWPSLCSGPQLSELHSFVQVAASLCSSEWAVVTRSLILQHIDSRSFNLYYNISILSIVSSMCSTAICYRKQLNNSGGKVFSLQLSHIELIITEMNKKHFILYIYIYTHTHTVYL